MKEKKNLKKLGLTALTLALGINVKSLAEEKDNNSIVDNRLNEIEKTKKLVESLELSTDVVEYDAKIKTIKEILDSMSLQEKLKIMRGPNKCSSPFKNNEGK